MEVGEDYGVKFNYMGIGNGVQGEIGKRDKGIGSEMYVEK